jgi:SnoaL-like domain
MTDRVTPYENYLQAWSGVSDEDRLGLLKQCISEDMKFLNQVKARSGILDVADHMDGFQRQMPGASFRLNNMVGWGDYALAEWQLIDAEGNAGFSGYDSLTFDIAGLISNIVMVTNIEPQKIVWRRRDVTLLERTQ